MTSLQRLQARLKRPVFHIQAPKRGCYSGQSLYMLPAMSNNCLPAVSSLTELLLHCDPPTVSASSSPPLFRLLPSSPLLPSAMQVCIFNMHFTSANVKSHVYLPTSIGPVSTTYTITITTQRLTAEFSTVPQVATQSPVLSDQVL